MNQYPRRKVSRQHALSLQISTLMVVALLFSLLTAFQPKPGNIQRNVDLIKASYYSENSEYHTDGQRTVWVKSYKNWTPVDVIRMKKNAPAALNFLGQAVAHNRLDVLEQLLPNYYRTHGGVQAFAADINKATANR